MTSEITIGVALTVALVLAGGCGDDSGGGTAGGDDGASAADGPSGASDDGAADGSAGAPGTPASASEDSSPPAEDPSVGSRECDGPWPAARSLIEQEILDAINALRETGGECGTEGSFDPADPLAVDSALEMSARCQAEYMASQGSVGFDNGAGHNQSVRAEAAGYGGFVLGVAIAASSGDGQAIFESLRGGDINCASFLKPEATDIGIGAAPGEGRTYVEVDIGK